MLTAQCDKLRKRAMELRQGRWSDGADDALLMEDAADTIEGLRDRLTVKESGTMSYASDALIDAQKNTINRLKAENEKLRELVHDMWSDGMCDCDEQYTCDECEYGYPKRMKELGIEVERCQA